MVVGQVRGLDVLAKKVFNSQLHTQVDFTLL